MKRLYTSICAFIGTLLLSGLTNAFMLPTPFPPHQTLASASASSKLLMAADNNNDNNDPEIAEERNNQRTCVKQFLTQRAIQSFMFLCEQVRDPHTGDWVERLIGQRDLLNFHGTGALNVTKYYSWEIFFLDLIAQPKATITIQAKRRGRGHGGWSKNNPYLKVRYVEFEVKIDPQDLVPRLLSVREQIASEFVQDVDLVREANEQILDSYNESVIGGSTTKAFDRNAYMMLISKMSMEKTPLASSPFRKGSFDLLQLLSLQEAIHLTLRSYMAEGESKEVSFQFLRDFYIERVSNYFDGYLVYGRADDFLEELLLTTPSVRTSDRHMELIDPLNIASEIIDVRSEVLLDWKEEMLRVPDDHMELRKVLLTKQMGSWMTEETSSPSTIYGEGSFE